MLESGPKTGARGSLQRPVSLMTLSTTSGLSPNPSAIAWHALAEAEVIERLEITRDGLGAARVEERQREFGRNVLPVRKPPTTLVILLHQFTSPLIYILLAAAVVAIGMGDVTDAAFIFGVVVLNAVLGAYQEQSSG